MHNLINYLGVALSLLGLGVVAPDAVHLWFKRVQRRLRWRNPTRPSLQIFDFELSGRRRLVYPDPSDDADARVSALEATVRQLADDTNDISTRLTGKIEQLDNRITGQLDELETTEAHLNAGGFVPVGVGIVCSGLSDELGAWPPLAWVTVAAAGAAVVWSAVVLFREVR